MQKYTLEFPGKVVLGEGVLARIHNFLPEQTRRVLVLVGNSAIKNQIDARLKEYLSDLELSFLPLPPGEPKVAALMPVIEQCRHLKRFDAVAAAGGGSVIDSGKIIAAMLTNSGELTDYHAGKLSLHHNKVFTIAIPTVSGAGAEVSPNAVLTAGDNSYKKSIRSQLLIPEVALIDSELTATLPRNLTVQGGFDALTQAIESFSGKAANWSTLGFSIQAFRNIFTGLPGAAVNDRECRFALAEGAMLAGLALQSGLGAVHALAHPIGLTYQLPHGLVCGILLPEVLAANLAQAPGYLDYLAGSLGIKGSGELIKLIRQLQTNLQLPVKFSPSTLNENDYPAIVAQAKQSRNMQNNPVVLSDEALNKILRKVTATNE
ncbi:MAG: iron-containing alcohol dehydrogenase [Lentisphaeria bacterium]|nr:iron-containing alcohol dehydrogenase [Lentisphaeria bacterium]